MISLTEMQVLLLGDLATMGIFYLYYLGREMVRPGTDQERKTRKCLDNFVMLTHKPCRASQGKHPVGHEAEGESRIVGTCCYCGFQGKEWVRQSNRV